MVIHVQLLKKDEIKITPEEIIENMNYIDNMLKDDDFLKGAATLRTEGSSKVDKVYVLNTSFFKNKNYFIILCIIILILFLLIYYIKFFFYKNKFLYSSKL
jgi:hypothetical protein